MFACIGGRARVCTPLLLGSGQTVHSCGGTQAEHLETEVSQQRLLSPSGDMIGLVSFGPCGGTPRSVCARGWVFACVIFRQSQLFSVCSYAHAIVPPETPDVFVCVRVCAV